MLAIKHILFPIDFSDQSCAAAPFVNAIATRFGAKVTLISALQPIVYGGLGAGDPYAGVMAINIDEIMEDLKTRLSGAMVTELARIPVERVVELGDPAQVITDFAHHEGVDLIMMPTRGYGPFRTFLLGSITAKVLHDAECPVWTSAHTDLPPVREHIQCRSVVCAIDATPKSAPLMQWAAEWCKVTGASLRLIHVIPSTESFRTLPFDRAFEDEMRKQAREQIERLQTSTGVDAPLCVAVGDIAEGVREEARRHGADLVLIGRGVLHETFGRLRTHAYGIIRHAPCPVLSV